MNHIFLEDFSTCGQLGKTWGNEGHLKAFFDTNPKELNVGDFMFLAVNGLPVPFQISDIKHLGNTLIQFVGLNTPDQSGFLTNAPILKKREHWPQASNQPDTPLEGFVIIEKEKVVGHIIELKEYPSQYMLVVRLENDEERLIPFVEEWILSIDSKNKELRMTLPEGLLS